MKYLYYGNGDAVWNVGSLVVGNSVNFSAMLDPANIRLKSNEV